MHHFFFRFFEIFPVNYLTNGQKALFLGEKRKKVILLAILMSIQMNNIEVNATTLGLVLTPALLSQNQSASSRS